MATSIDEIPGKGRGVVNVKTIAKGETIFSERPLISMQSIPSAENRQIGVIACANCLSSLNGTGLQLGLLAGTVTRSELATSCSHSELKNNSMCECVCLGRLGKPLFDPSTGSGGSGILVGEGEDECERFSSPIWRCKQASGGCGNLYCSTECRDVDFSKEGHSLLCTGGISYKDHPLLRFKQHAVATNEIFLLVAKAAAKAMQEYRVDETQSPLASLDYFHSALWWDVAPLPESAYRVGLEDREMKLRLYRESLKLEAREALRLMHEALCVSPEWENSWRGLGLNLDWVGRLIGAVQMNQIGFRVPHPVLQLVKRFPIEEKRSLEIIRSLIPWIEAIENEESAFCDDEDCEEEDYEEEDEEEEYCDEKEEEEEEISEIDCKAMLRILQHSSETTEMGFTAEQLLPPLDGACLCTLICTMNHSCEPNVKVSFLRPTMEQQELPLFTSLPPEPLKVSVIALDDIIPGQELVFAYVDPETPVSARRKLLFQRYGFHCTCPKCTRECECSVAQEVELGAIDVVKAEEVSTELSRRLHHDGLVSLKDVVPTHLVVSLLDAVRNRVDELIVQLKKRGLVQKDAGSDVETGLKFFRFKEICQRSFGRFDLRFCPDVCPFKDLLEVLHFGVVDENKKGEREGRLRNVVENALGKDFKLLWVGVVLSKPGSEGQDWHTDGPHLFTCEGAPMLAPPHCLNVFIPLIDVTPEVGPTQFLLRSHHLATALMHFGNDPTSAVMSARFQESGVAPLAEAGDAIVFDYRTVHRGTENSSKDVERPLLYLTFAKKWFVDAENFPDTSVFD